MQYWQLATIYYIVINIIAFFMYGSDKKKAKKHTSRTPESTLILMSVLGGGIGSLLGMRVFHHKTQKPKFKINVPLFTIIHIICIIFFTYQNNHVVETYYIMENPDIDMRVVQLSDIHNVTFWWNKDYLSDKVEELNPDLILITGDIVDGYHTDMDAAIYTAERLAQIAPTYYVTGNHDYYLNNDERDELLMSLRSVGVEVLVNENRVISGFGSDFTLIGLDDLSLTDGTLEGLATEANESTEFNILMAHEPQYFDYYSYCGAKFVFSGHVHGGQFVLPGDKGMLSPEFKFFPEYDFGEFNTDSSHLILSRGLGNSVIPYRINNYPEIIVVDF